LNGCHDPQILLAASIRTPSTSTLDWNSIRLNSRYGTPRGRQERSCHHIPQGKIAKPFKAPGSGPPEFSIQPTTMFPGLGNPARVRISSLSSSALGRVLDFWSPAQTRGTVAPDGDLKLKQTDGPSSRHRRVVDRSFAKPFPFSLAGGPTGLEVSPINGFEIENFPVRSSTGPRGR
jgi:hypothetical protein